ncbi:unnamed protein product, partial [marine sediment metagenome]
MGAIKPIFDKIKLKKTYIGDRKLDLNAKYVEWNVKTFIKKLMKHDLAIITHVPHWAVDMKSPNRLMVCMAIGLPT